MEQKARMPTTLWGCFKAWRALDAEARQSWKMPEEIRRSPLAHAALLYLQMLQTRPVFAIVGMAALITVVPYQVVQWFSS